MRPRGRPGAAGTALVGLVLLSTVLRLWAARGVPSPWYTPDELIYGELGQSLYRTGHFEILSAPVPFYSLVYPALAGLPLSIGDLELGYGLLKAVQALLMSLTAVPVYLWARSLTRTRWALVAAALTLAVPGLAFSGFVMTEVAFYPLLCLAAWAMARALARPSLGNQALLVAAIAAAIGTRLQAIVLVPALVLAIVLEAVFSRKSPKAAFRLAPALAALVLPVLAFALAKVATGGSAGELLGAYRVTGQTSYGVADALRYTLYHAADLLLLTAVFPPVAVALLLGRALAGRERSPEARAYLAVAVALTVGLVVEVGVFTSRLLGRLAERNLLGLAPILFVGLALWLDRGAPRPRIAGALAAGLALAALLALPLGRLVSQAAEPDAFSVIPLYELRVRQPELDLKAVVVVATGLLLLALLLLPRRLAWVLPLLALALLVPASVVTSRVVSSRARDFRSIMAADDPRWIDRAAQGPVSFLYAGEQAWSGGAPAWVNLFWNDRIASVYDLPGAHVVGPLPQQSVSIGADGRLSLPDGAALTDPYLAASTVYGLVGAKVADAGRSRLALWRLDGPARLSTELQGSVTFTAELGELGLVHQQARLVTYG